jgi:hypothetical protein
MATVAQLTAEVAFDGGNGRRRRWAGVFIAVPVFDGIRRRLGVGRWLMFNNGGGGWQ